MVMLSYPSANRDEDVYDDPMRFDVGRQPNKHLAFGFGVHYCLGAMLARMELKALLTELVPRLRSIELAGEPPLHEDAVRRRPEERADPLRGRVARRARRWPDSSTVRQNGQKLAVLAKS